MNICRTLCLIFALIPLAGWAERGDLPVRTTGWYAGFGAGFSQMELSSGPVDISGSDFGYKLFGGYRFPRAFLPWGVNVALQAAYVQPGDIYDQSVGSDFNLDIDGIDLAAVGILPISRNWEFFGKAGAFLADTKVSADGIVLSNSSDTELSLGIGFAWQTGTPFGVQVELENFGVADGVWLTTVSGTYQFK